MFGYDSKNQNNRFLFTSLERSLTIFFKKKRFLNINTSSNRFWNSDHFLVGFYFWIHIYFGEDAAAIVARLYFFFSAVLELRCGIAGFFYHFVVIVF